jgi:hypothetical protein
MVIGGRKYHRDIIICPDGAAKERKREHGNFGSQSAKRQKLGN